MKKYKILKPVILGFLTPQEQYDIFIDPETGVTLESNGHTIWVLKDDKRQESITTANAIDLYIERGDIREILD